MTCSLHELLFTGSTEICYNSLPPHSRDDYATLAAVHHSCSNSVTEVNSCPEKQRAAEYVDEYIKKPIQNGKLRARTSDDIAIN